MWMLGLEPGPSGSGAGALNCWIISPAPHFSYFYGLLLNDVIKSGVFYTWNH